MRIGDERATTFNDAQMTELTDAQLVARALEGDRGAFGALYGRHAPVLGRRLRRILGARQEAEDALQVTFLEVHRSLHRYRLEFSFGAWVHGIAIKVSIRALRSRKRRAWLRLGLGSHDSPHVEPLAPGPASDEHLARQQLLGQLELALNQLSAKKRVAFVLHEIDGMGFTEIAALLGETTQTVWARVDSARKEIQKHLRGASPTADEPVSRSQKGVL